MFDVPNFGPDDAKILSLYRKTLSSETLAEGLMRISRLKDHYQKDRDANHQIARADTMINQLSAFAENISNELAERSKGKAGA